MNVETPPILLREERAGVVTLTLNRPGARNALSRGLMAALIEALDELDADQTARVVIIAGAGPGFCAGHDLREIRAEPGRAAYEALFAQCSKLMLRIQTLRQPVIAQVHGVASAAGCQLAATCDLAVADPGARFATPGVNIGLFCSTPMVALTRAVGRKAAMRMLLTGEMLDADAALSTGLVSHVSAPGALAAETAALAARIAAKSPLTLAIGKRAFYEQAEMPVRDAYEHASAVMTTNMLARDAEEGVDAFLEKRDPVWEGR
ncbi:enoyl-CoA hydratase [Pikeienuella piscinae]|uniref:Enoyl-CoA hydratase domain-containing protein 3, mitochondrial n=1 Tax=Pikeienuella piscinae TaxID=2748098 RepID=A0A7M3T5A8_9RHOB|nr:enoyl-CoA hydratase [Pikeienuella piscinae]QIE57189.1 enoyl-CoA hydratase [Pikeienuella piscinae]